MVKINNNIIGKWIEVEAVYFNPVDAVCVFCWSKSVQIYHKRIKRVGYYKEILDMVIICQKCENAISSIQQKQKVSFSSATYKLIKNVF